ncbi:hypothetical protein MRX96_005320 [Rhipicephalus microplus]
MPAIPVLPQPPLHSHAHPLLRNAPKQVSDKSTSGRPRHFSAITVPLSLSILSALHQTLTRANASRASHSSFNWRAPVPTVGRDDKVTTKSLWKKRRPGGRTGAEPPNNSGTDKDRYNHRS